jgi:hypothetical protein
MRVGEDARFCLLRSSARRVRYTEIFNAPPTVPQLAALFRSPSLERRHRVVYGQGDRRTE